MDSAGGKQDRNQELPRLGSQLVIVAVNNLQQMHLSHVVVSCTWTSDSQIEHVINARAKCSTPSRAGSQNSAGHHISQVGNWTVREIVEVCQSGQAFDCWYINRGGAIPI